MYYVYCLCALCIACVFVFCHFKHRSNKRDETYLVSFTSQPDMGSYVPDCDEFFLHLSSADARNSTNSNFSIPLSQPKDLKGVWKLALKEISYTSWDKEKSFNDEMEFIVMAREQDTEVFRNWYESMVNRRVFRRVYEYTRTAIQGFPNAAVVSWYKYKGDPTQGTIRGPEGQFSNVEEYIREVNQVLHEIHMEGDTHAAPYFYLTDKNTAFKTVNSSWNYAAGHHRQIFIFPILGHNNRRLLGFPQDYTKAPMIRLLQATYTWGNYPEVEIGEEGFTQKTDNIFVLCDLVKTTGAQPNTEGQILRIIPNKQLENGKVVFHDFSEDYYDLMAKSHFFAVNIRLVSSRDYRDLNLVHPVTLTLHLRPVNNCKTINIPKIVPEVRPT